MIVRTATQEMAVIAMRTQCQYSRSQFMPAMANRICSKIPSDTTTTR